MRVLLLALLLGAAAGCDETFVDPPRPDLYKSPYDFALPEKDSDLGVPDLGPSMDDLSVPNMHPDLSTTDA